MLVVLLDPRKTIASLLLVAFVFLLELLFRGVLPRLVQILFIRTCICIMLTHMISWVLLLSMWPSIGFPSPCLLTLQDPRLGFICPLVCRNRDTGGEQELEVTWSSTWGDQDLMVLHIIWVALQRLCTLRFVSLTLVHLCSLVYYLLVLLLYHVVNIPW